MYVRQDILNSRGYAEMFKIAQNALKTILKLEECSVQSIQQNGDPTASRPDFEFIFFEPHQLNMICFDYAFSASENFLEHIGFMLCNEWDSSNKQRHYTEKLKTILMFDNLVEKKPPNENHEALSKLWQGIFTLIDPKSYANRRNPIKHIHSGKHEIKTQIVSSNNIHMNSSEHEQLIANTYLDITKEHCEDFINKLHGLIMAAHSFLVQHKLIFKAYRSPLNDAKTKMRKNL